jgi:hypothetical protein
MRDFSFQTEAKLFNLDTFAQPLRKKSSHLVGCKNGVLDIVRVVWLTQKDTLSKGANMLNENIFRQRKSESKGGS